MRNSLDRECSTCVQEILLMSWNLGKKGKFKIKIRVRYLQTSTYFDVRGLMFSLAASRIVVVEPWKGCVVAALRSFLLLLVASPINSLRHPIISLVRVRKSFSLQTTTS